MVRTLPQVVQKVLVELEGVPETLLWTLYHRAVEARRRDAVLDDPLAIDLVERLDYPFAERFGGGSGLGQWQALRAATFDREVRRFAAAHPGGTVVALGEGLDGREAPMRDALDHRLQPSRGVHPQELPHDRLSRILPRSPREILSVDVL